MSIKQKIWKTRRDGVRQRYLTAIGVDTTSRAVGKQIAGVLESLDFETFLHLIQTPQAQSHIDMDWSTLVGEVDGMFEYYLREAMRYAGDHAKPLIDHLFNQPLRHDPQTGEFSTAVPIIMDTIEELKLKEYAQRIYREHIIPNMKIVNKLIISGMNDVSHEDWEVVSSAIRAAARLGERSLRPVVENLMRAKPDNWAAHRLAAECIPTLWPRDTAIRMLYEMNQSLARSQSSESLYYLRELARLHATKYADHIREIVSDAIDDIAQHGNYSSYARGVYELMEVGYPPKLFDSLVKVLEQDLSMIIDSAIVGLGEMRDPRAIPYLLPYILDENKRKSTTTQRLLLVMEALAKMKASEYIDAKQANELLDRYVSMIRDWDETTVYDYVLYDFVRHIQRMGDPRVLPIIERHLRDETRLSRRVALYTAYAGVGGEDAVPFLTTQFAHEPPQVQSAIVRALRRIDTPDARRFLQTVPNNPNASTLAKLALRLPNGGHA